MRPIHFFLSLASVLMMTGSAFALAPDLPSDTGPTLRAERSIAVQADAGSDAKIKARLLQLFGALDGLGLVQVDVSGGVVALSGEVPTAAVHEQALGLVRRIDGVVEVRDQVTVSRDLRKRLEQLTQRVTTQLLNIVAYLPLIAVAGAVLALFWWVSGVAVRSPRLTRHFGSNPFIRDLVRQGIRLSMLAVGTLIALEVLDASTLFTSLLGAAGVVGLAVGFALRDTVENYIASLLLSLRQPFARGDLVTVDGAEGRVVRLNARATVLLTLDGNHLRIPNAKVYKAVILNYTRNPKRRFHFDVGVDTEQNLAVAQTLAAQTLLEMKGVVGTPPPVCNVESLGDSNVVLRTFGWVDQSLADFLSVRSEAIRLVKGAFDRAGIVMPEPIYSVHVEERPARAPDASARSATPAKRRTKIGSDTEPQTAIDVARKDDSVSAMGGARSADEEDLLHAKAEKE